LEVKSERSSRANNIPQLGSSLVSHHRKPGLHALKLFLLFAQPREQSTPIYINWNSSITTLLARLELVTERQQIEGDDKIKILGNVFHRNFMLQFCSIRYLRENMTLGVFGTGYSSCLKHIIWK